jgi:hypothetical protein
MAWIYPKCLAKLIGRIVSTIKLKVHFPQRIVKISPIRTKSESAAEMKELRGCLLCS